MADDSDEDSDLVAAKLDHDDADYQEDEEEEIQRKDSSYEDSDEDPVWRPKKKGHGVGKSKVRSTHSFSILPSEDSKKPPPPSNFSH